MQLRRDEILILIIVLQLWANCYIASLGQSIITGLKEQL